MVEILKELEMSLAKKANLILRKIYRVLFDRKPAFS